MELKDIQVSITLDSFFMLSYYRRHDEHLTVSLEWLNAQGIKELPGIENLLHFREILSVRESATATLVEIWPIEAWRRKHEVKDFQEIKKQTDVSEAKSKHNIIELWKRSALTRLMKTGKLDAKQANEWLVRAMNPTSEIERKMAIKLEYPFAEELVVSPKVEELVVAEEETTSVVTTEEQQ